MEQLRGKTAVVTGAASGIGRALARVFGREGMKLVLSDIEMEPLEVVRTELEAAGVACVALRADVSQPGDVEALAEAARDAFEHQPVHLLCNNAGVFTGGACWDTPAADYEWVLGVNVWGVIHGIRVFLPAMIERNEGHVVNTASMAGLVTVPMVGAYAVSKHATVALSECLHHDLAQRESAVSVSVLCPEVIATRIAQAGRNRPAHLKRDAAADARAALIENALLDATRGGVDPAQIAERTLDAVRAKRFYVLPPEGDPWRQGMARRFEDILAARNPTAAGPVAD